MKTVTSTERASSAIRPLVELRNVSLSHQERILALRDVTFRVLPGEFVFVVGHTGSGKSSLLRLLNRELRPTSGQVWDDGRSVGELRPQEIPALRRKMGVVFQDFRLLPDRTLEENIAFALRVIGVGGKELRSRTFEALKRVGLLSKCKKYPHQVSGGEQQRAGLARAIVNNPRLLLADEPTGNLDPDTSLEIMALLEQINQSGTTVIMATHDQFIVDTLGKRVVALQHGRVVRDEAQGRYSVHSPPLPAPSDADEAILQLLKRE